MASQEIQKGRFIGNSILLSILCAFIFLPDLENSIGENLAQGMLMIYIGLIFIASYYFEKKSFVFRFFIGICENVSWPEKKETAFVYATLLIGFGIATSAGLLNN